MSFNMPRTELGGVGKLVCPRSSTHTVILLLLFFAGCASSARLTFPRTPLLTTPNQTWYDTNQDTKPDFVLIFNQDHRLESLAYDDDQDGHPDRIYPLSNYSNDQVPHLIILLDSIPFQPLADACAQGDFPWFDPPQKVIAPFPSLTEICYSDLLHCPPLPGVIDQYWEPRAGRHNGLFERAAGHYQPWERRLDYHSDFLEQGLAYLRPRVWHAVEVERVRQTFNRSADRVTICYVTSASGMMCRYGRQGLREILDDLRQLCLQILHERHGAVKISVLADHGHNLTPSKNLHLDALLTAAGFHPADSIKSDKDVVVEINGLVTYAGIHTRQPAQVADALLKHDQVEFTMYMEGDAVLLRSAHASARIDFREGRVRYTPIAGDPLDYAPILEQLKGKMSTDGDATDDDWFAATKDHNYPDAPRRIWDAFHTRAVHTPTLMITLKDGYCAGLESFSKMIDMQSTHGGLNQLNTATFVMTMTGRTKQTLRTREVLSTLEPGYNFPLKR
jgi:hypothetical protein